MDRKHEIHLLINIVKGIAKIFGPKTEVVLHDLQERKIVCIENSYITGRTIGYRLDDSVYEAILNLVDEEGHLIGYTSNTKEGKQLRSSHFIIRDEGGQPIALICINQDISTLKALHDEIGQMISTQHLNQVAENNDNGINYIQQFARQLILSEIEKLKPTPLDSKESKIKVIAALEQKGVFEVKDSVPQICKLLDISQATLYNYLREIRQNDIDPNPAANIPLIL